MSSREVKLVITGTHKRPGISHIEDTKTEAVGQYRSENCVHIIEYEEFLDEAPAAGNTRGSGSGAAPDTESKGGGRIGTYNLVEITPKTMTLTRKGSVESELRFQEGLEHVSEYKTPFGAMKSKVCTTRYATYVLEKGNRLIAEAEYTVSMNGMEMSETTMRIDATLL